MNKIKLVVLTIVLTIILIIVEIVIIKNATNYKPMQEVMIAKCDIEEGTIVNSDMYIETKVDANLIIKGVIVNKDEIIGKIAINNIYEGEFILEQEIEEINKYKNIEIIDDENRMIIIDLQGALKCSELYKKESVINLLYIPKNGCAEYKYRDEKTIENVRIAEIFDSKGNIIEESSEKLFRQLCVEVNDNDAEFLLASKYYGYLELIFVN